MMAETSLLTGKKVRLRRLRPEDLDFLYRWENDPEVWLYGDCGAEKPLDEPATERFSRDELRKFIENQRHGIHATEQLRLMICHRDTGSPVGMIDIFDFDPVNRSAGVGIIVCDQADRRHGYASEALELVAGYAGRVLGLNRLWCSVDAGNIPSIELFRKGGFVETDIKLCGKHISLVRFL